MLLVQRVGPRLCLVVFPRQLLRLWVKWTLLVWLERTGGVCGEGEGG